MGNLTTTRRIAALVVIGFLSGLATCASAERISSPALLPFTALIFGVALSTYSWWFERIHSFEKAVSFVINAIAAFYIAILTAAFGLPALTPFTGGGEAHYGNLEVSAVFLGGFVGTALLAVVGCVFLFDRQNHTALLRRIVIASLAGAALGAYGFIVGPYVGIEIWKLLRLVHLVGRTGGRSTNDTAALFSMFVIWQTLVAPLLCFLFPYPVSKPVPGYPDPPTDKRQSTPLVVGKRGLTLAAFVFLTFALARGIREEVGMRRSEAESRKSNAQLYSEAPSLDKLSILEVLPPARVLVMDVKGYVHDTPSVEDYLPAEQRPPAPAAAVPARTYRVNYEIPSPGQSRRAATVRVVQSPNAAWAVYRIDHPIYGNPAPDASRQKVSKFGHEIYLSTSPYLASKGNECYAWPSENFEVNLCLDEPTDERFLRAYLLLYPSSLN